MPRIIVLVFVLFALTLPVTAQDTPEGCTRLGFADMFSEAADLLTADDTADDPAILGTTLSFFLNTIQTRRASCAGLAFEGNGGEVVGPFDLPAGDYVLTGTFTRSGNLFLETLTDDCELYLLGVSLGVYSGDGGSQQTILQSDERCRILVEASTSAPWTLTFAPIS